MPEKTLARCSEKEIKLGELQFLWEASCQPEFNRAFVPTDFFLQVLCDPNLLISVRWSHTFSTHRSFGTVS